ncbi:epidermal retinol dehydrogenase 2-like [Anolis sagrei]|uniref:epidermal retinol dehydrogenase 2-like n=1 Tax=Anolis sagrei TaxID=38937 RepID=UPI00295C12F1|nr:epidermal retinol dehydrogenase 2-like [Anolis sagrei ordinatus]
MKSMLRSLFDTIEVLLRFLYYSLEELILKFSCYKKNVAGKIVLITGSANGIGRELAIQFARLGSILVLWDIDEEGNNETGELAKANGALAVCAYRCDVGKREEIYAVAEQVRREVGDVDILINNAGILKGKTFLDLSDSDLEETLDVNTASHFWTCKAFLPAMVARNEGHLVTTASVSSLVGSNKLTATTASKYATFGFMEALAFELQDAGKKGIQTTIVCPYLVDTELITGAQTLREFFFPILDAGYVAKEMVDAILKEKLYLVLPSYARLLVLKIFFPKKIVYLLAEYLGLFRLFDHFRGEPKRGQKTKEN